METSDERKTSIQMAREPKGNGPVIGIATGSLEGARPYDDIVRRSGGVARPILPDRDRVPEALRELGGLIVAEGAYCGPAYEARPGGLDQPNEEYLSAGGPSVALLEAALADDMPLLAVSGGMHALNVTVGGGPPVDAIGHAPDCQNWEKVSAYHRVYIAPGTKLAAVVGSGGFVRVNSRHRQGIKEAQKSPRLLASAYSLEDGIIEALESPEHRWVIGVQFRPELRGELPPHFDRLFQSLAERAGEFEDRSP